MKKTHKITTIFFGTALLLLVMVLFALPAWEKQDPPPAAPDPLPYRFGVYSPGSLAEVSRAGGAVMIEALGLSTLQDYENYSMDMIGDLGVGWVRIDFLFDGWNFDEPDYVNSLHNRGYEVVGTARPIDHFAPADLTGFEEGLRSLVRRYPYIKVWQIGNEPNIRWQAADYARLFDVGQRVVREECPDCKVALAGIAASYPSREGSLDFYGKVFDALKEQPHPGRLFDVFDFHYYATVGLQDNMLLHLEDYRALLARYGLGAGVEYWVTETSTHTGHPVPPPDRPPQTEEQQASELVRRFVTMLGAGLERIAWSRPYENYRYHDMEDNYYDHNAMVYNGLGEEAAQGIAAGTRKLSFHAYHTLIEKLDGFNDAVNLAPGEFRFSFDDGRPPVYVFWGEGATLPPELTGSLKVTGLDGAESIVDSGNLTLGVVPVFVEAAGN